MAILVSDLRLPFTLPQEEAVFTAVKRLSLPRSCNPRGQVIKRAVDARHRHAITFVYTVLVTTDALSEEEQNFVSKAGSGNIRYTEPAKPWELACGSTPLGGPVVIAGFGPAGMFAALSLIEHGYPVVILERGGEVDERVDAIQRYWNGGALDSENNVQYGEGGAGTFSDGKLTTRISDPRCRYILEQFVRFGAPQEILWDAKPHIGTDLLRDIVKRIRQEIVRLGGEIHFHTKLDGLRLTNSGVSGISANGRFFPTSHLILAIGHSAEDTYRMLHRQGVTVLPKPFSVGMRIEHLQSDIDRILYGDFAGHPALPKGSYALSYRRGERAVYTFCMCPGGMVVPAASSPDSIVTNGMSNHARDGENANSALVVSVSPSDFGSGAFDGFSFQRRLEHSADRLGKGLAPAVTVGAFLDHRPEFAPKKVTPSYPRGVTAFDPDALFPPFVTEMMREGLRQFDRKLHGFCDPDAVLTGPETRTSSPVSIPRDELCQAAGIAGLYPCGEGPGKAGGIMSAAVDGLRVAESIMKRYAPKK